MRTDTIIEVLESQARSKADSIRALEAANASLRQGFRSLLDSLNNTNTTHDNVIRQRNYEAEIANARIAELEAELSVYRSSYSVVP